MFCLKFKVYHCENEVEFDADGQVMCPLCGEVHECVEYWWDYEEEVA